MSSIEQIVIIVNEKMILKNGIQKNLLIIKYFNAAIRSIFRVLMMQVLMKSNKH